MILIKIRTKIKNNYKIKLLKIIFYNFKIKYFYCKLIIYYYIIKMKTLRCFLMRTFRELS